MPTRSAVPTEKPGSASVDLRTDCRPEAIRQAFLEHLLYTQGKSLGVASRNDLYQALAYAVRDRIVQRWARTAATYRRHGVRTVAYLSAEFLMGPYLGNNLLNLHITAEARAAIESLGLDLNQLIEQEAEPGLGNGGLGRLAACFIESLATQEIPAIGYGIRYEYGIFHQHLVDGWQVERTDTWLRYGSPWEFHHAEWGVQVQLGGYTEHYTDDQGRYRVRWVPDKTVIGTPFDVPVLGYQVSTVNTLRLWRAEATEAFDLSVFNRGDYLGAVSRKVTSENLTKVLYPNDESEQGKILRLEQQYFFVSCALQDMVRILLNRGMPVTRFHEVYAVQLNDTHPAIGVAELMRLLVDEHLLPWDEAWTITGQTFAYTNHTLLPEALEKWPLPLFSRILPRHLEIILEINARFLNSARIHFFGDDTRISRLSLIDESSERYVCMAHLACVGSHRINGVASLHSELLKREVLPDFHAMWPEKFDSITNGVTPRRWLALSNPHLTALLMHYVGDGWIRDLSLIDRIEAFLDDAAFRTAWQDIRRRNKAALGEVINERCGVSVDPDSLFDVMVKRIHEYKRQHLAVLHIVTLYQQLKSGRREGVTPRTFIFGGKAAPGYQQAKLIIRLITAVGEVINSDPDVADFLKVVFLPNFNVSLGQAIYPAADLSEQISLAGKEASGTGNMKFAMNGALTIGTMDGANIEIRDAVGAENFFTFGMDAAQVLELGRNGYDPQRFYLVDADLKGALDLIRSGYFSRGDTTLFAPLVDELLNEDRYRLLADYASYVACQTEVEAAYSDRERWTTMSIRNCARSGRFSSDRSIREYCERVWQVKPIAAE